MKSPHCTELWSEQLAPRIEAKPFGVPNARTVLLVQRQDIGRVELLTEVSKTDNGKFYIVVFQKFLKAKTSARNGKVSLREAPGDNTFDDIKVKEMWQVEAI